MFFTDTGDDVTLNACFAKKLTKTSTITSQRPFNGRIMKRDLSRDLPGALWRPSVLWSSPPFWSLWMLRRSASVIGTWPTISIRPNSIIDD